MTTEKTKNKEKKLKDSHGKKWHFWIDRGGTFTDVLGIDPAGHTHTIKVLSSHNPTEVHSVIKGMESILQLHGQHSLKYEDVGSVRLGTTVATNALLERKGSRVGVLVTKGFEDALIIGDQSRPDLFALEVQRPKPLYECILGIEERVTAHGQLDTPFDSKSEVYSVLKSWKQEGIESLAICLLHSLVYSLHEVSLAQIAADVGFTDIFLSHQVSSSPRWVNRSQTTVLEAYLSPMIRKYTDQVRTHLSPIPLHFMSSSGGLVNPQSFSGTSAILSGPAGGVIGAVTFAKSKGFTTCVGLDMGGTSTDVFYWNGQYQRTDDTLISGVRIQIPMLRIHTIASGGGSIITLDRGRLRVGPHSAGSDPGPASYGRGGPATLTDANLIIGRLMPSHLPSTFGLNGTKPLSTKAAFLAFAELIGQNDHQHIVNLAYDAVKIAEEQMAQAIRKISLAEGHSLNQCPLIVFGGAGGQFACGIAKTLSIKDVLIHPLAGILSAWGIGHAPFIKVKQKFCLTALEHFSQDDYNSLYQTTEMEVSHSLKDELPSLLPIVYERSLKVRVGQSETVFEVDTHSVDNIRPYVARLFKQRFGYSLETDIKLWVTHLQVIGQSYSALPTSRASTTQNPSSISSVEMGPKVIAERLGTVYVSEGWSIHRDQDGSLTVLFKGDQSSRLQSPQKTQIRSDEALIEIYQNRFMSIAKEMGLALQKSAQSVNIRERMDFSCALFNAEGELLAHAPHIPVHLGSMGAAVKAVIGRWKVLENNDMVIVNSPMMGGTHLPDLTVVSQVDQQMWLAARGHHTDIGGITPGSMPSSSQSLEEEGVVIDGFLVKSGCFLEDEIRGKLLSHRYPVRNIIQNINDIRAQIAALHHGSTSLRYLLNQEGHERVAQIVDRILSHSESALRAKLPELTANTVINHLDQGQKIKVHLSVKRTPSQSFDSSSLLNRLSISFKGTSSVCKSNRNTPPAITSSAILYSLRLWLGNDVPLNEGIMRAVDIELPKGSFLDPPHQAAVVAGNVEISQALVDSLLEALDLQAHGQGTMNNLTLGWVGGSYYETICGGTGAGPNYHGCHAIHCHMTNSRLTDPEVFERTVPMQIEQFCIRVGSGGMGEWSGGHGVKRIFIAQDTVMVSILSSRRMTHPKGLKGGDDAKKGLNLYKKSSDTHWVKLRGNDSLTLHKGDQLCILTPGGGGYSNLRDRQKRV